MHEGGSSALGPGICIARDMNWAVLLKLGLQHGLRPSDFWKLTPAELLLVLGLDGSEKPLNRARLAELEQLYCDQKGT